jgi:DNA-binding MarR family transcriptional regulator
MRKSRSSPAVPGPGQGKRGEEGYLGYLLRQAGAAHRLRMERAMSDIGVTVPQFLVLTMLAAYPGHSNADLARLALLTPQTVSVIVANLERMGALARRPHAVHGRIQHLDLTEAGRRLLARCRDRAHAIEQHLLADLPAQEERIIRKWLVRVAVDIPAKDEPV